MIYSDLRSIGHIFGKASLQNTEFVISDKEPLHAQSQIGEKLLKSERKARQKGESG